MCNANLSDANWALIFAFLRTQSNRVVPLDNFMIYKDIIRLDRPD